MKPQTLALAEHLTRGGTVNRQSAWSDFTIQNLTARLSELTALGYPIIKRSHKRGKTRITEWMLPAPIMPGTHVQVSKDIGTLVVLKGRRGIVEKLDLHTALATVHIPGVGYRSLKFNILKALPYLAAGSRVRIKPAPYVVLEYHPAIDSYTLTSADPEHTIVAHASLVEAT